jgi:hypothetical protein
MSYCQTHLQSSCLLQAGKRSKHFLEQNHRIRRSKTYTSFLHTYLVGASPLKKGDGYRGVSALHIAVDASIKCPSGLLSAYFLALP